jgi:AraC-like DNA-binding protein
VAWHGPQAPEADLSAGTRLDCLWFRKDVLLQALSKRLGVALAEPIGVALGKAVSSVDTAVLFHLAAALQLAEQREGALAKVPGASTDIGRILAEAMLLALAHNHAQRLHEPPSRDVLPGFLKRATAFVREHLATGVRLQEVAHAAGVSPRTLQVAFQRFLRCTPTEFVKSLQLEGARRDLLNPDASESVSAIAERWGFRHPGIFAAKYKRMFGELPRATRHQARAAQDHGTAGAGAS